MESAVKYELAIARLRKLRISLGLTLKEVERLSEGRWKAIVIGSYERGARKLTLEKAVALCDFYGADISRLGLASVSTPADSNFIIDLKRLRMARADLDPLTLALSRLASWTIMRRGDWNGELLSLRRGDFQQLEIFAEIGGPELIDALNLRRLLFKAPDRP